MSLKSKGTSEDNAAIYEIGLFRYSDYGNTESLYTDGSPADDFDFQDDYINKRKRFACVRHSPDAINAFKGGEKASRAFGVIGYLCHTFALLFVMMVEIGIIAAKAKLLWLITRILIPISLLSSLCIFSIFGSDYCQDDSFDSCDLSSTGVAAIVNIIFIIATICLSWIVGVPENPILMIRLWRLSDNKSFETEVETLETENDNTSQRCISTSAFRYTYLGLIALTWIFWNIAIFHCSFLALGWKSTAYGDREVLGLFNKALREDYFEGKIFSCSAYTYGERIEYFDAAFKSGRFWGALGYLLHTVAFLVVLSVESVVYLRKAILWRVARVCLGISFLSSILIFSAYGTESCMSSEDDDSEMTCVPYAAGIIAIWNIVLLLALMVVSFFISVPVNPIFFVSRIIKN